MRVFILASCAAFALTACQMTPMATKAASSNADSLTAALQGQTFENERVSATYGADGSLTGSVGANRTEPLVGTWRVEGDAICRTIIQPKRHEGTECQPATLEGDTLTIVSPRGTQVLTRVK